MENSSLASVLYKGDVRIQSSHRQAIVILGLTRNGSTTVFNWMCQKTLIGMEPIDSYYVIGQDQNSSAEINHGYKSITIFPNVEIDFEQDVSLIDMPGFFSNDSHTTLITSNYFSISVFGRVRSMKFVLVLSQDSLLDLKYQQLIKMLSSFINTFLFQSMNLEVRRELLDSVLIVITKSTFNKGEFLQLWQQVKQKIQFEFQVQNKAQIIQIMKVVGLQKRIILFAAAQDNKKAEIYQLKLCEGHQSWKYFNLDQSQKTMNQTIINSYRNIDLESQEYDQEYKRYKIIFFQLQELLSQLQDLLENALNISNLSKQQNYEKPVSFKPFFNSVQLYLKKYSCYNQNKYENANRQCYRQILLIQAFHVSLNLFSEDQFSFSLVHSDKNQPQKLNECILKRIDKLCDLVTRQYQQLLIKSLQNLIQTHLQQIKILLFGNQSMKGSFYSLIKFQLIFIKRQNQFWEFLSSLPYQVLQQIVFKLKSDLLQNRLSIYQGKKISIYNLYFIPIKKLQRYLYRIKSKCTQCQSNRFKALRFLSQSLKSCYQTLRLIIKYNQSCGFDYCSQQCQKQKKQISHYIDNIFQLYFQLLLKDYPKLSIQPKLIQNQQVQTNKFQKEINSLKQIILNVQSCSNQLVFNVRFDKETNCKLKIMKQITSLIEYHYSQIFPGKYSKFIKQRIQSLERLIQEIQQIVESE